LLLGPRMKPRQSKLATGKHESSCCHHRASVSQKELHTIDLPWFKVQKMENVCMDMPINFPRPSVCRRVVSRV
jgi:hypothetical protein